MARARGEDTDLGPHGRAAAQQQHCPTARAPAASPISSNPADRLRSCASPSHCPGGPWPLCTNKLDFQSVAKAGRPRPPRPPLLPLPVVGGRHALSAGAAGTRWLAGWDATDRRRFQNRLGRWLAAKQVASLPSADRQAEVNADKQTNRSALSWLCRVVGQRVREGSR